ncbi:RNA recognition protein [Trichoderma cornu-damae]|uniref:RNA recognition protein n=1 Tax=Trichoderma cornu-damae TaxID=654480 RepID=A0A9P8TUA1_9HYPO|nr:RNA recognition protein [Trichoderma cornu-damae]
MTEAENFEDDLFADLYEDTDAKPAAPVASAVQNTDDKAPDQPEPADAPFSAGDGDNASYDAMNQDADDDEDDVDFNLGGGGPSNNNTNVMPQDDMPATPPYGTVHKASAKEDG